MGRCGVCAGFLQPMVEFLRMHYSRFLHHPMVEFIQPIIQFFINYIFPILEFFLPISVTSVFFWLLLRPNNVVPRVDAAVIASFNLTAGSGTLDYDMAVDLSFHNRKYLDARYLDLVAVASYGGTRLGPTVDVLPVFVQRSNATNAVHAVFQGAAARLTPAAAQVYAKEAADGEFNVLVTVSSTFMYNVLVKKVVYHYYHECYIRFPTPHGGAATVLTPGTLCTAIAR